MKSETAKKKQNLKIAAYHALTLIPSDAMHFVQRPIAVAAPYIQLENPRVTMLKPK